MSKAIDDLAPAMKREVILLCRRCVEEDLPVVILETRRDLATQMAYYSRGRAPVGLVKEYFKRCGLWDITDDEAKVQNTKTLYSKHIDGLAVDIAPARDGRPWWDAPIDVWEKLWLIAEDECELDACAGGKYQAWKWDLPHIEYRG